MLVVRLTREVLITVSLTRAVTLAVERSYSGEGEDMILKLLFDTAGADRRGFYVDVGAHDPHRFSNTHLFYRRGWRGINIDATPGSMRLFNKYRPGDVNIESGVGTAATTMQFYVFNEPAVNSFDAQLSRERHDAGPHRIEKVIDVPVAPLKDLIHGRIPSGVPSFLTVDVEGVDLDVLQSNDWGAFRPDYVLAECYGATIEGAARSPISTFLASVGYEFVAKTVNTSFYRLTDERR